MEKLRHDTTIYYDLKERQETINRELQETQIEIKRGIIENGLHDILTINWRALTRMLNSERKAKFHNK